jgi:hypothetical protein
VTECDCTCYECCIGAVTLRAIFGTIGPDATAASFVTDGRGCRS